MEDKSTALYWYEQAAGQGHPEAQFNAAVMYEQGQGTPVDKAKALYWTRKPPPRGAHRPIQLRRDVLPGGGHGPGPGPEPCTGTSRPPPRPRRRQHNCGVMYQSGFGAPVDLEKALSWYEKAAEQGNTMSQVNCGSMYLAGQGTPVDKAKAFSWFETAARLGMCGPSTTAASVRRGRRHPPGPGQSPLLVRESGEQGYADAQYNCGYMYYLGEGTDPDKDRAYAWYEKAARQGFPRPCWPAPNVPVGRGQGKGRGEGREAGPGVPGPGRPVRRPQSQRESPADPYGNPPITQRPTHPAHKGPPPTRGGPSAPPSAAGERVPQPPAPFLKVHPPRPSPNPPLLGAPGPFPLEIPISRAPGPHSTQGRT